MKCKELPRLTRVAATLLAMIATFVMNMATSTAKQWQTGAFNRSDSSHDRKRSLLRPALTWTQTTIAPTTSTIIQQLTPEPTKALLTKAPTSEPTPEPTLEPTKEFTPEPTKEFTKPPILKPKLETISSTATLLELLLTTPTPSTASINLSLAPTTSTIIQQPTPEPTKALLTKAPTSEPKLETCPWPPTNIFENMEWELTGDAIKGKVKDLDLWYQYSLQKQPVDIANDGNTVIMGTPWPFYGGTAKVDVLNFDGKSWQEEESFSGSGDEEFGGSISLSGDGKTLAIGAKGSDEGGEDSGHVEVYQRTEEGSWKPKGDMIVGLKAGDWFGTSVSLSQNGNQLAIGAPYNNLNGKNSGSAHIFQFDNKDWVQLGQVIAGKAADDRFGRSVSLSADGNIIAVGAPRSDENGSDSGSVQVFGYSLERRTMEKTKTLRKIQTTTQEGGQWLQIGQKLLGQAEGDWFGRSLSINAKGDTIAVGTSYHDYAKVFRFQDEQWKQVGKTLVSENYFGTSVSIAANAQRVAVGPWDEEGGHVRVYDYNGDDWIKVGDITASTSEKYFGNSLSLSSCGDRLAVGLIYDDGSNNRHGHMKVYEFV